MVARPRKDQPRIQKTHPMPYAEFQPSHAGSQLNADFLRTLETGSSLMERAARNRALMQHVDQRAQRFVTEQALSDQKIQENRLLLSHLEGQQAIDAVKNRATVAEADAHYQRLAGGEDLIRRAALEAPQLTARLDAETDPTAIESLAADFLSRYAPVAGAPEFGARFDRLAAPISHLVATKPAALRQRYAAAAQGLWSMLNPNDPDSLRRIEASPFFEIARRDPEFDRAFAAVKVQWAEYQHAPDGLNAATPIVVPGGSDQDDLTGVYRNESGADGDVSDTNRPQLAALNEGPIGLGRELTVTGLLREEYNRRAEALLNRTDPEAIAARDALKIEFRQRQTALGKVMTEEILRKRKEAEAAARAAGRPLAPRNSNAGKTNSEVNRKARMMKNGGRVLLLVGAAGEIYTVVTTPEEERAAEAVRAGGRFVGGLLGAEAGASMGAIGGPIGAGAGAFIGGIAGAVLGEEAVNQVINSVKQSSPVPKETLPLQLPVGL